MFGHYKYIFEYKLLLTLKNMYYDVESLFISFFNDSSSSFFCAFTSSSAEYDLRCGTALCEIQIG